MARKQLAADDRMTVEEFLAFAEARPDEERWELIEGIPVMNAAPVEVHQVVVTNLVTFLMVHKRKTAAAWLPLIGVGTRVPISPQSLPQPDVYVKAGAATNRPVTDDALVLFEVLSKSNSKSDQVWRRRVYASVPNCQHYVTVSLKAVDVVAFDRATGWKERRCQDIGKSLTLPGIDVSMPLAEIYRYTPVER